ncbi:sugar ABC transporter ATP-binding protein [Diplocloster agilis]|uniref:sugar ABC transporter ATP-binding protein n=1 Tax=Diplocloster agilis TaxID=2850323 RepID=UPI000822E187|nr:sugar ABC transporter ATP-binding protein [Suonthocola fibrivorans]MCU6735799.1 sugar ABC transporter ATP-binding protein [Suonthocola fibrivorans]SCJ82105.1 Ribose import ATP-binding protein RbsA [uncultured Clostridium sp.]
MGQEVLLSIRGLSKSFGITRALKQVSLDIRKGQILGLIGENGSGKSTLSTIVAAIQKADEGEITFEGKAYHPADSVGANRMGVCMILQEKATFSTLTAAKNIFMGKESYFVKGGILHNKEMIQAAQKILDDIGADHIRANQPVSALTFEDAKLVELARAMYDKPKLLIVDETTTALSRTGRDILYGIMERMKKEGRSVLFISHDIDELMEICDTLTVLRDGDYIDTLEKPDFDAAAIRRLMVGRELSDNFYRTDTVGSMEPDVVLKMEHVSSKMLQDVSFELHKGEILGFGGLADCGMHELGNIAFGLTKPDLGEVRDGQGNVIRNAKMATRMRIAYISKNRDTESLMVASNIKDNICLASYGQLRRGPFVTPAAEKRFVDEWSQVLEVKMQDIDQYVMELSGGNKQKVALAKWLGFGADVFIMDCPTRGIDIGVKSNIYRLMEQLKAEGKSILLISEELPEVIGMSDRVVILKDGKISGVFGREEQLTETKLIDYMV